MQTQHYDVDAVVWANEYNRAYRGAYNNYIVFNSAN